MSHSDFLAKQRKEIHNRLAELRPHYEEYLHLEKVQSALDQVGDVLRTVTRRRGPGRPRKAGAKRGPGRPPKSTAKRATGRPTKSAAKKSGRRETTRADQALKLIRANPGISVPDLAKRLRIQQNYLYRVVNKLRAEGKIERKGHGLHVAK